MSIFTNKTISNIASNQNVRKFTSKLCSPSALLPVVLLEGAVIAGRTYHAQQRGGDIESRERFTEEVASSVTWLWGIQFVNKAFDFFINKVAKIQKKTGVKDFNFDTGNDNVREPFAHATKGLTPKTKNLIAALKFSKIVASAGLAVGFMGFVLPKINQNLTKKRLEKREESTGQHIQPIKIEPRQRRTTGINEFLVMSRGSAGDPRFSSAQSARQMDINEFLSMSKGQAGDPIHSSRQSKEMDTNDNLVMSRGQAGDPTFKNGSFFELAAHQLENNHITQLLTQDAGLFTGRAVNARNKYERREILFRDIVSSFFYVAATPLIYMGLCAVDTLRGKNTRLDPNRADELHGHLDKLFMNKKSLTTDEFQKEVFGTKQVSDDVFNKAANIFDKDVTTVAKMHQFIGENVSDTNLAQSLKDKAFEMSKLQPEKDGKRILTKSQLNNVFFDGMLNDSKVINNLINESTDKKAMDPFKFVAQKDVDKKRKIIVDYAQSILEQAKKENKTEITKEFLGKMKTRNLVTKLGYWGAGMAVSAYFLSTAIPKMQYLMTQKATGHNDFPGIQTYENDKTKTQNKLKTTI